MFKIRDTSCYDINVTCTLCPKDDLLKSLKFEFRVNFWFLLRLKKKLVKLSVKMWRSFDIIACNNQFVCFVFGTTTMSNSLLRLFKVLLHEKMQKRTYEILC